MKNKAMMAGILTLIVIMSAGCIGNETGTEETKIVKETETRTETKIVGEETEIRVAVEEETEVGVLTKNGIRIVDFGIINTEKGWRELDKKITSDPKGSEAVLYQAIIFDMKRGILSIDRDSLEGEGITFVSHGVTYKSFIEFDNIYTVDVDGNYVMTSVIQKSGYNVQIQLLK